MNCTKCNLFQYSDISCIPGRGGQRSKIMIVSSYASDRDVESGVAVMPPHLVEYLTRINLRPQDVYYTNLIKCRAPKGTKYKVSEIKKCKTHLDDEINKVKPQYVLLIGAQAVKAVLNSSITELNGVTVERSGIKYVPAYSPGIIYSDPGKANFVERAFNNFRCLINGQEVKLPDLNIKIIKNLSEAMEAFRYIRKEGYKHFSYDIETTGLSRFENTITLFGFGCDKVQFILPLEVPFSPLKGKNIAKKKIIQYIVKRLNKDLKTLIAGNGKFDDLFTEFHYGVKPKLGFDIVLSSHILNENTPNGVKGNAIVECNALDWDIDLNLKKGNVKTLDDYNRYITYLGYDIYYEHSLYRAFHKKLKQDESIYKIYKHLYMPAALAYEEIERNGVYIHTTEFKQVRKYLEGKLNEVINLLSKWGDDDTNWNSPKQISKILYDKLNLPITERTETGEPSTSESTLLTLVDHHPIVELILQYRGIAIQISHFIDGWINRMYRGRIYPSFKIHGTVTGRTSCTDPNLQQVPRDPIIRSLIGAPPGWSFVEADFSQAELRIATLLSGDPEMRRIYQTGGDIHISTFENVSHEKISEDKHVRKEQRKKAKAVNFGFIYGMGWKKFRQYAREKYGVKMTEGEAKLTRKRYFEVYKMLPEWHKRQRRIVKVMGQVRNPIGRLRRLPDIYSSDSNKVAEAERQAINSPVQGFGSDLTILGMVEVLGYAKVYHKDLVVDKNKFKCVGTVHDATLFEVRNNYLMTFVPRIKAIMESPKALTDVFNFDPNIPMIVDISVGRSWGSGIELDFKNNKWKRQIEEYLGLDNK